MKYIRPKKIPLIVCVGRNYVAHAEEMKAEIEKDPAIFFKHCSSYVNSNEIYIPQYLGLLHYEVELTVLLKHEGKNIKSENAKDYISGYGIGIDFTLRELQKKFKEKGLPWELSKSFDNSAYLSEFVPAHKINNIYEHEILLKINGKIAQKSKISLMIHSIDKVIAFVSNYITIKKNYVIMTGTPAGIGEVKDNDLLTISISGIIEKTIKVKRR